jgi:hypothetical protein
MEEWANGIKRSVMRGPGGRFASNPSPPQEGLDEVVKQSSSTGGKRGEASAKKYNVAKAEKPEIPSFIKQGTSDSISKMSKKDAESADKEYDSKEFKDAADKVGTDLDSKAKKGSPFKSIMDAFSGARDKVAAAGGAAVQKISDGVGAAANMASSVADEAMANGDMYAEIASVAAMTFIQSPATMGQDAKDLLRKEADVAMRSIQSRYMEKQDKDKLLKRQADPEKERQKILDELKMAEYETKKKQLQQERAQYTESFSKQIAEGDLGGAGESLEKWYEKGLASNRPRVRK